MIKAWKAITSKTWFDGANVGQPVPARIRIAGVLDIVLSPIYTALTVPVLTVMLALMAAEHVASVALPMLAKMLVGYDRITLLMIDACRRTHIGSEQPTARPKAAERGG